MYERIRKNKRHNIEKLVYFSVDILYYYALYSTDNWFVSKLGGKNESKLSMRECAKCIYMYVRYRHKYRRDRSCIIILPSKRSYL